MIRLTDAEIRDLDNALIDIPEWINEADEYKSFIFSHRYFAKAQLKKFLEWDRSTCPHPHHRNDPPLNGRKDCFKCWQSLLEEVK